MKILDICTVDFSFTGIPVHVRNFYNELNDKYTNNSIKTIKGKIVSYKSINKKILLSIVLNEIFYAFIISKELKKLRIAFSISEKVENLNRIIEECKK